MFFTASTPTLVIIAINSTNVHKFYYGNTIITITVTFYYTFIALIILSA